MKAPCEIVAKYVLPATRALIVRILIERYGYTQIIAASKLGMTQSAMSRYLTLERGTKIMLSKEARNFADKIASDIASNQLSDEEILIKFCEICKKIREKESLCKNHIEPATSASKKRRITAPT